jgi:hypothetical protein
VSGRKLNAKARPRPLGAPSRPRRPAPTPKAGEVLGRRASKNFARAGVRGVLATAKPRGIAIMPRGRDGTGAAILRLISV